MLCEFFRGCNEDGSSIFPEESEWHYRWGWQGVLTAYRYVQLKCVGDDEETPLFRSSEEKYDQARFSCIYGQPVDHKLRLFVVQLEQQHLATRDELKTAIRYRDLRLDKANRIRIKCPTISAILGTTQIAIATFCSICFLTLFYLAPLSVELKVAAYSAIISGYSLFVAAYIASTIKPYFVVKRIGPTIQEIISLIENRSVPRAV